jgi:pilus assembly protein Flp/PilA
MLRSCGRVLGSLRREEGQGLVEYAMLVGLIALGVFSTLGVLGRHITGVFTQLTQDIQTLMGLG